MVAADRPAGRMPAGGSICLVLYNRIKLEKFYDVIILYYLAYIMIYFKDGQIIPEFSGHVSSYFVRL